MSSDGLADLMSEAVASVEKHQKKPDADSEAVSIEVDVASDESDDSNVAPADSKTVPYDRFVRMAADFENFRKRAQKEKFELQVYGGEELLLALLPVFDNLERAIHEIVELGGNESVLNGLNMVMAGLHKVLNDQNIEMVKPLNQPFNPILHEAVDSKETSEVEDGVVLEVHLNGYKLKDKLVRPAQVTVAKKVASKSEEDAG